MRKSLFCGALLLAMLSGPGISPADELAWPDEIAEVLSSMNSALEESDFESRHDAYWQAEQKLRAFDGAAEGVELTRNMFNQQVRAEESRHSFERSVSALRSADADFPGAAADLVRAVYGLREAPLTKEAASQFKNSVETYDNAAQAAGLPTLRESLLETYGGAAGKELGEEILGLLDGLGKVLEGYNTLDDLRSADRETQRNAVSRLTGMVPVAVLPNFPAVGIIQEQFHWTGDGYYLGAEGVDLVTDAIQLGRVDGERLAALEEKLNSWSRGPWSGETARQAASSWCGRLSMLGNVGSLVGHLCNKLFDFFQPTAEAGDDHRAFCAAHIDCDCDSITGGLTGGVNRVTCKIQQSSLISACEQAGEVTGSCNPAGPGAFPQ